MKVLENGIYRDMTEEEIKKTNKINSLMTYEQRVAERIRAVYSVDDELAILRQRDTKPDEFAKYNDFAERIKEEERNK